MACLSVSTLQARNNENKRKVTTWKDLGTGLIMPLTKQQMADMLEECRDSPNTRNADQAFLAWRSHYLVSHNDCCTNNAS